MAVIDRGRALEAARLYFICDSQPGGRPLSHVLPSVLAAGVDIFQLRDKSMDDEQLLELGGAVRRWCDEHETLFVLNDRPDLAVAMDADGVHVGQDDVDVQAVREVVGEQRIVGLSTHTPRQIHAAPRGVDYIGVGPIHETPTKPGRAAVGVELVRYATAHARVPFFAIGGLDAGNVAAVLAAGGRRVAVVRAIAAAGDPAAATQTLRARLDSSGPEVGVGAA